MHVHARARTHGLRAKQTHTSQSRFLLQLFVSPWHFEACSCLPVSLPRSSLPPPPPTTPPTLLFHFVCSLPPFHNPLNMSEPSFHRVTYQIFHHVTANKVKCGARFFSQTPFSSFSSCCVTAAAAVFFFYFISCLLHATLL